MNLLIVRPALRDILVLPAKLNTSTPRSIIAPPIMVDRSGTSFVMMNPNKLVSSGVTNM